MNEYSFEFIKIISEICCTLIYGLENEKKNGKPQKFLNLLFLIKQKRVFLIILPPITHCQALNLIKNKAIVQLGKLFL